MIRNKRIPIVLFSGVAAIILAVVSLAFPTIVEGSGGQAYYHPGHPGLCFDPITGLWLPCGPDPVNDTDTSKDTVQKPGTKSPFVSLTIENNSSQGFYLWLRQNSVFYYLAVPANTARQYTIFRDNYTYEVEVCGARSEGKVSLSSQRSIRIPDCLRANWQVGGLDDLPAGLMTKLVLVTFVNKSTTPVVVRLSGVDAVVLPIAGNSERSITIPRGDYDLEYSTCGDPSMGVFTAAANAVFEIECR